MNYFPNNAKLSTYLCTAFRNVGMPQTGMNVKITITMIKVLVFDLGGVLLDLDLEACYKSCREKLGFERVDEFVGPCHQKGLFMELEAGNITAEKFYQGVLAMSAPGKTPQDVNDAFRPFLIGLADYKVPLLKELSQKYDLYLLSNNNAMTWPFAVEEFEHKGLPIYSVFKKAFLSFEMHCLKPGDTIYQKAISEIQRLSGTSDSPVQPSEMLFIDDSPINVEAARRNGMQAAHYIQGDDLRALLSKEL